MARAALGAASFPLGVAIGTAVGGAAASAIDPRLQTIRNEAWERYQSMPLQAVEAAQLVAEGERDEGWGAAEAAQVGVNGERFRALVDLFDTALEQGLLMDAFRRGIIGAGQLRRGAKKHGLEDEWIDVLVQLKERPLSAAEAAAAWQQGYMEEGPSAAEAELTGTNASRSSIQRRLAGLPPGIQDVGMRLLRRGVWDAGTFVQAVRESNIKTKYAEDLLVLRNEITSPLTAAGLWLRGWITEAEAKSIGALSGYGPEQMEHLYLNRGRPATVHQIHIGYARGARLEGAANEEEAIKTAVKQSNIRTEYEDLLYAQRHTYPSAFVLRALAADGTFTAEQTEQILVESGWRPDYAALAAAKWTGGGAGPQTKWADRARSRLFTAAHSDYLDGSADEADARALLTAVGVSGAEQDTIIGLWGLERDRTRRDLTQAQVLRLYKKAVWPREQAMAALLDLGMEPEDAADLLDAV